MRRAVEILVLAAALAGCASETFAPDTAAEFAVTRPRTPFYRLGPAQMGPPDAWLAEGDRVRLLRREFGYSFARLPDGQMGYVANKNLAPAPEEEVVDLIPPPPASGRPLPVVEEPLPRPDLDASPEDAPL